MSAALFLVSVLFVLTHATTAALQASETAALYRTRQPFWFRVRFYYRMLPRSFWLDISAAMAWALVASLVIVL